MEPTGLRIPPAHREALTTLRSITEEQFDLLLENLVGVPPFAGASGLTDHASKTEGLAADEAQAVVLALLSLYAQLKFHGWTSEDLAVGVAHSDDLPKSDADPSKLAHRLQVLLDLESVVTTGRALDLLTEHEHLFHSARILTDIRPVFGDDPKEPPSGALIIEALKVEYFDEGGTQSLYLALSRAELRNLRDTVDRALEKSDTVHDLLEQIGMSHFEAESEV
jgi:hypothetical protein